MSEELLGTRVVGASAVPEAAVPAARKARRFNWQYAPFLLLCHLIAVLAFFPWFFSWTGVVLCVLGCYAFGTLGITVGFHRLLTHRSFACPRWVERTLSILGVCCVQDSPAYWVAIHRRHHHYADVAEDPHSPLIGFFWAHVGWLLVKTEDMRPGQLIDRYAKDMQRDPFQQWLEKSDNWAKVVLLSWAAFFALGFGIAMLSGGSVPDAIQLGSSVLVWLGAVRILYGWHTAWAVNSVGHLWGYRNYETRDLSRNNVIVGLLASGEGWHNNHHADPNSARHGHKWWELDLAWLSIRLLMAAGLAWNVKLPSPHLAAQFRPRPSN